MNHILLTPCSWACSIFPKHWLAITDRSCFGPAMKKEEAIIRLRLIAYERLCAHCWSGVLSDYLDRFLG